MRCNPFGDGDKWKQFVCVRVRMEVDFGGGTPKGWTGERDSNSFLHLREEGKIIKDT